MKHSKIISIVLAALTVCIVCALAAVQHSRRKESAAHTESITSENTGIASVPQEETDPEISRDHTREEASDDSGGDLFLNVDQTNEHPKDAEPHIAESVVVIEGLKESEP